MSNTIPVDSLPAAVIGYEVRVSREDLKQLRSEGTLILNVHNKLTAELATSLLNKHKEDIEVAPLDGAFNSSGRAYRLELVTFSRRHWLAHHNEWMQLEAERDMYKAELEKVKTGARFPEF